MTFLLLGTLRRIELLSWRVEQLEYKTPRRIGRDGLRPGTLSPDFELENISGGTTRLSQFRGHQVLLVFTQMAAAPVMP